MSVLIAFVVGVLVARALVFALADVLASPVLDRENYRGHHLPTAGGLVIVLGVVVVEGLRAAAGALGIGDESPPAARVLVLVAVVGFGLLGLLDDLLGDGDARGFRGHLARSGGAASRPGSASLPVGRRSPSCSPRRPTPTRASQTVRRRRADRARRQSRESARPCARSHHEVRDALLRADRVRLWDRRDRCRDCRRRGGGARAAARTTSASI